MVGTSNKSVPDIAIEKNLGRLGKSTKWRWLMPKRCCQLVWKRSLRTKLGARSRCFFHFWTQMHSVVVRKCWDFGILGDGVCCFGAAGRV